MLQIIALISFIMSVIAGYSDKCRGSRAESFQEGSLCIFQWADLLQHESGEIEEPSYSVEKQASRPNQVQR